MTNYKHTGAAIEAANDYTKPYLSVDKLGVCNHMNKAFLAGVEWAERWTPVSEDLPIHLIPFLAVCDGLICIGHLYEVEDGTVCISVNGSLPILFTDAGFTHWKHLPNPPQE